MDERFRDFDAAEAERRGSPLRFRLGGREFSVGTIGALAFLNLARAEGQSGTAELLATVDFIREAVGESQRPDLEQALKSLSLQGLRDLSQFLIAAATGAPFVAPASSPARRSRTGKRSKAGSLSVVTTPSGSASAAS